MAKKPDFLKNLDGTGRTPRQVQVDFLQQLSENWTEASVHAASLPVACHALGQKVWMYDGTLKRIEDIVVGDSLVGPDGSPRRVVETHLGNGKLYEISVRGGSFTVTGNHVLPLLKWTRYSVGGKRHSVREYTEQTVQEWIESSNENKLNTYLFSNSSPLWADDYIEWNNIIPPYLFGIWLGDGTATYMAITNIDSEIICQFTEFAEKCGMPCVPFSKYAYRITNGRSGGKPSKVLNALRQLVNLDGSKSLRVNLLKYSPEVRLQILAGVIDSDGHVHRSTTVEITQKRKELAETVRALAGSLGYAVSAVHATRKTCQTGFEGMYYRMTFCRSKGTPDIPTKVPRKTIQESVGRDTRLRTFDITEVAGGTWAGITVDGDNLYLLDSFIVTHNCGKSLIAKAIQNVTGASIITPQNILIDQYSGLYPDTNSLKGAAHYECCTYPGLSCEDVRTMLDGKPCGGGCLCPYSEARRRAQEEPTFFNPLSLFYCPPKKDGKDSDTIIVDEAHSLLGMLRDLTTKTFSKRKWGFDPDKVATEVGFDKWLAQQISKLGKLRQQYAGVPKEFAKINKELTSLGLLQSALRFDMQNYVISLDEEFNPRTGHDIKLSVAPIVVPANIIQRLLGERRIILLSGTLFSEDIKELVGHKTTKYYDLPSPIPVANRPIYYRPIPSGKMNRDTPIADVVAMIEEDLRLHPNVNTIIHTTYSLSEKMVSLLRLSHPRVLANTSENKQEVLTDFKENGGIFVACGCSEGLDLKDDIARLNIIPKLDMPNLGDPVVIKRKALDRGESWYRQQGLKLSIQRWGRTTRHEKDFSTTIIHDPNLPRLILDEQKSGGSVPKYFTESLVWGK